MSEKITLFIAIWIIVVLFITGDSNLEIFFVLILVGMLVAREFTDRFTTIHIKQRLNIFILMFIIIFMVLVTRKIINVWSI